MLEFVKLTKKQVAMLEHAELLPQGNTDLQDLNLKVKENAQSQLNSTTEKDRIILRVWDV